MNWAEQIARPNIVAMTAYSARGESTGALHLDANESPWAPPPGTAAVAGYNRYPGQQPPALRQRLADIYGVKPSEIAMGRGADEAIDVLVRTFCTPGQDRILLSSPTFSFFNTVASLNDCGVIDVPGGDDFLPDMDAVVDAVSGEQPKIIFLCSPNNPTGHSLDDADILRVCEASDGLVVLDEAYIEFSDRPSFADRRPRNLVVTRTLSKLYGLAGVRLGAAIADKSVIELMLKVMPPYPVPKPVIDTAMAALSAPAMAVIERRRAILMSERDRVADLLPRSEFVAKSYNSDANFILFEAADANTMLAKLDAANIRIRDFRSKLPGHFRLSIGTPEENDLALAAFGVVTPATQPQRIGETFRTTKETDVAIRVNLDDPGEVRIDTGLGFYDHMLEQIAKHGGLGLTCVVKGDLEIDAHHTVEDTALALGSAMKQALGDRTGIGRYGFVMPMDETQARVAIDLSGRPAATFKGDFPTDHVGEFAVEMCPHFFASLAQTLGAAIQIEVEGENSHHMIEACFKGVGRALRPALAVSGTDMPSTKGVL
ncbi:histidinol-phosphate transaminase [uncultured Algimonas sp.]|uniref:histidinol-phosphate transaminase n=1 Tax=uncultured Algimonas sp. TaxID=1547920 RepID=UPI00261582AB|nr:histidinol-phosphate transaminase [uncultured Algimonas sp.]